MQQPDDNVLEVSEYEIQNLIPWQNLAISPIYTGAIHTLLYRFKSCRKHKINLSNKSLDSHKMNTILFKY